MAACRSASPALIGSSFGLLAPLVLAAAAASSPLLASFTGFEIGGSPQYLTAADLNGDGRPDLVTALNYSGEVRVALGLGGGTFGPPTVYAPSSGASRPVIADFTGDGIPDIAIADFPNTAVVILPGTGDGTFGTPIHVDIGFQCYTVATADLDLDGHLDLIAANWASVAVRLGAGGGSFGPVNAYPTATNAFRIAVGYLNDDPYPDVVTAGDNTQISVLLGNGNGTLQPFQQLGAGQIVGLEVADATGDGHADIVVGGQGVLSIFAGDGSGGFATRDDIQLPATSGALHVADLDGDGKPDVIVGGASNTDLATVLLGDGAGGFPNRISLESLGNQQSVWSCDADGDGHPDLLTGGGSGEIAIHFGEGAGRFGQAPSYGTGAEPIALGLGDLDGDGHLDVVAAHHGSTSISVRRGNGDGTFGIRRDYEAVGSPPQGLAVGDLDRDGRSDVAVAQSSDGGTAGSGSLTVFLGYAGGTFASSASYPFGQGLSGIAIGDLNGDQAPDLAVSDRAANRLSILINAGNGSFAAPVHYGAGDGASGVAIGDLDGDGHPDVAVANEVSGSVTILFGDGTGALVAESELPTAPGCHSVAIGRINGDGTPDLVTANGANGTVAVLIGEGAGRFAPALVIPTALQPASVAIAPLNRDPIPDLVLGFETQASGYGYPVVPVNLVGVLPGIGDGTFQPPLLFGAGAEPQQVAVGDLDGDGGLDVVAACRSDDVLAVLMNRASLAAVGPSGPVAELRLGPGYPNPAVGAVAIPFTIPRQSEGSLTIYDVTGRAIRTLVQGTLRAGPQLARWDRRTDAGSRTGAGVYFYELRVANHRASGRLVLL